MKSIFCPDGLISADDLIEVIIVVATTAGAVLKILKK